MFGIKIWLLYKMRHEKFLLDKRTKTSTTFGLSNLESFLCLSNICPLNETTCLLCRPSHLIPDYLRDINIKGSVGATPSVPNGVRGFFMTLALCQRSLASYRVNQR